MGRGKAAAKFKGPTQIADETLKLYASMVGEDAGDELEDLLRDAIWEAFTNGRISGSLMPVGRRAGGGGR